MTDQDTKPDPAPEPRPAGDDAAAGWRVIEEQQARIAALRAAVLSGAVPDEEGFDYVAFFAGRDGATP